MAVLVGAPKPNEGAAAVVLVPNPKDGAATPVDVAPNAGAVEPKVGAAVVAAPKAPKAGFAAAAPNAEPPLVPKPQNPKTPKPHEHGYHIYVNSFKLIFALISHDREEDVIWVGAVRVDHVTCKLCNVDDCSFCLSLDDGKSCLRYKLGVV